MKITNLEVHNYKIFHGTHVFNFKGNLIFFVGENNTGKSTLFEAIEFVRSGLPKEKKFSQIKNKFADKVDHISCTITLKGNLKDVINDFSESKYLKYVFIENDEETIVVKRSSKQESIKQAGKTVDLDIKKITIWNPDEKQFENPSGIDKVIGTLFEAQFVWADTNPSDITDFGSTKICGRLLNEAVGDFFESDQWGKFVAVHKETFHGEEDSLGKRAANIEKDIKTILKSQYGIADVKFDFSLPETATFYKTGEILVDDGANTKLEDKGTGMQRAVALAIIQVYAKFLTNHPKDVNKSKPLFFFIDEPEICLHPKAQEQLLMALKEIAKVRQIFVSTHSPYFLKRFNKATDDLFIFNRIANNIEITPATTLNLFGWSPSLNEINYKAYQICSVEFHNELYGHIQEKESKHNEREVESYFQSIGHSQSKPWVRIRNGIQETPYNVTLMTFIRNTIHHPENRSNADFTPEELRQSIESMIAMC